MLRRTSKLEGSRILALDGDIGKLCDIYFDDERWIVRYLVVDTGGWLSGRKVLISPRSVESIDRSLHTVSVSLTRERIRASPSFDTDKPVSRQHESDFYLYYGYPTYWPRSTQWITGPLPPGNIPLAADPFEVEARRRAEEPSDLSAADSRLRSIQEVSGYGISASNDNVGHVKEFLFDDETWSVRFLVVDTGGWLLGRHVLVNPDCIREVDWGGRRVRVSQTREQIKQGSVRCERSAAR